jgi:hypothetical protein
MKFFELFWREFGENDLLEFGHRGARRRVASFLLSDVFCVGLRPWLLLCVHCLFLDFLSELLFWRERGVSGMMRKRYSIWHAVERQGGEEKELVCGICAARIDFKVRGRRKSRQL